MKNLILYGLLSLSVECIAQVSGNNIYEKNSNYNYNTGNPGTKLTDNIPQAQWIDERTVMLEVNALSNQTATSYTAIFNMKQLGQTSEEADRIFNERFDAFVNQLIAAGVKREDIYLDLVSFVPVYEFEEEKKLFSKKTFNEIPKGFEIQQNVHIRYTDHRQLGKMMSAAAKNEIYDIVKVDYFVENSEEVYHDLRKRAVEYINKEIAQFEILGLELDDTYRFATEEEKAAYPNERYVSYKAFSSQSLDGTSKGKINNADKALTHFYQKVAYDDFEIIVNPALLEPAVQFMYSLKVKFRLKQPEPKVEIKREKEFVWLTPNGELRTLKVENVDAPAAKPNNNGTVTIPDDK
jgi:uncharacterized protein YggE